MVEVTGKGKKVTEYEDRLFNPEEFSSKAQIANQDLVKVAFGRYVKNEQYDIFDDYDLSSLTEQQKDWMDADKLRDIVFNPPLDAPMLVDGLALNPFEYNLIVRSPKHLGKFVVANVLNDADLSDDLIAASERGKTHAFEQKLNGMAIHKGRLYEQRQSLRSLSKEAQMPGYAHKTSEEMKQLISSAWREFITILDVVHIQRGWDDEQRHSAEAVLVNYLTTGSQRQRIGNWQKMINLADNYVTARIILFNNKIRNTESELR